MKLQILGCGTSTGVPLPGCKCKVCLSTDSKNKRTRTAAIIKHESGYNVLIDAGPDLRMQALSWNVDNVNAVLFTHAHADHIFGIDDLRSFNFVQREAIPCFGNAETLAHLRKVFAYVFEPDPDYPGGVLPQLSLQEIFSGQALELSGIQILPFNLDHVSTTVLGFRVGDVAYATDCKSIPEDSLASLAGVRFLVLSGLRYKKHNTHLTIDEAIEYASKIGAEKTFLTHMSHDVDYQEVSAKLPKHVALAYDGLELEIKV